MRMWALGPHSYRSTISATHLIWGVYAGWEDAYPSSLIQAAQSEGVAIYVRS
jgi:hypothetical protein